MKSKLNFNLASLRRIPLLVVFFLVVATWTSCEKDYHYIAPPATGTMSLSADIQPIFTAQCAMSGCHDGNFYDPDLREGFSHAALFNIPGCIDTLNPESSDLYVRIIKSPGSGGFMPDGGSPLPSSDINKILLWIQQGARDN
jgi:hypothetical protein